MTTERLKVENLLCLQDGDGTVVLSPKIHVGKIHVSLDTEIEPDGEVEVRLDNFDVAEIVTDFFRDGDARDECSYQANVTMNAAERRLELNDYSIPELIRYIVLEGDFAREYDTGKQSYTRANLSSWYPSDAEHEFISAANAFKQACINFILPKDQRRVNNAG